jgi:hypothetical protein
MVSPPILRYLFALLEPGDSVRLFPLFGPVVYARSKITVEGDRYPQEVEALTNR